MKKTIAVLLLMISTGLHADIGDPKSEKLEITENKEHVQVEICVPEDLTASEAAPIVAKYLKDNPELNHKDALEVASSALLYAYPCGDT